MHLINTIMQIRNLVDAIDLIGVESGVKVIQYQDGHGIFQCDSMLLGSLFDYFACYKLVRFLYEFSAAKMHF